LVKKGRLRARLRLVLFGFELGFEAMTATPSAEAMLAAALTVRGAPMIGGDSDEDALDLLEGDRIAPKAAGATSR
jgi:hypothetical protein